MYNVVSGFVLVEWSWYLVVWYGEGWNCEFQHSIVKHITRCTVLTHKSFLHFVKDFLVCIKEHIQRLNVEVH